LSWSSNDSTTPSPTAAATGSTSVARKVDAIAICDVAPVRQMVTTWLQRSDPTAA
jgi:hypothetical protein